MDRHKLTIPKMSLQKHQENAVNLVSERNQNTLRRKAVCSSAINPIAIEIAHPKMALPRQSFLTSFSKIPIHAKSRITYDDDRSHQKSHGSEVEKHIVLGSKTREYPLQRSKKPTKAAFYSPDMIKHYGAETLTEASENLGLDKKYTGHLSKKKGASESPQTKKAMTDLAVEAKKIKGKKKAAKKSHKGGQSKNESKKDDKWKAYNKGEMLINSVVKGELGVDEAFIAYIEYLEKKSEDKSITGLIYDDCIENWNKLKEDKGIEDAG